MKASEKIAVGLEQETECLPFTQEEFNVLLDAPADQLTPRELRLCSTILILVTQAQETRESYQSQIQKLNLELSVKEARYVEAKK